MKGWKQILKQEREESGRDKRVVLRESVGAASLGLPAGTRRETTPQPYPLLSTSLFGAAPASPNEKPGQRQGLRGEQQMRSPGDQEPRPQDPLRVAGTRLPTYAFLLSHLTACDPITFLSGHVGPFPSPLPPPLATTPRARISPNVSLPGLPLCPLIPSSLTCKQIFPK